MHIQVIIQFIAVMEILQKNKLTYKLGIYKFKFIFPIMYN